jgi:hypothetical protein
MCGTASLARSARQNARHSRLKMPVQGDINLPTVAKHRPSGGSTAHRPTHAIALSPLLTIT